MLLNALFFAPVVEHQTSAYVRRAPAASASFLYGVAIIAIVVFVFAVISSLRVTSEPPK
jgi:hypothetical protein